MQKTSRKCYFFRPFLNPYSQSSLFPPETFSVNRHLQRHKNKSIQYAAKVGEEGEATAQDGVYLVLPKGKQKGKQAQGEDKVAQLLKTPGNLPQQQQRL